MNILILGSGGREHALLKACLYLKRLKALDERTTGA